MTEEELDKEAGKSWWNDNNCSGSLSTKKIYICGFLASAEPREKRIAEQEELLNSTLEENKDIYKKMADLDTALEDCTESLTDARIKIKELEKANAELKERKAELKGMYAHSAREAGTYEQFLELKEKENADLEKKISILLSCKNCPENKGGLLCQKEYEDKCLAQKIQYIKELKEENEELNDKLNNLSKVAEVRLANWQKYEQENAELKAINEEGKACVKLNEKLSKAKGFIEKLLIVSCNSEILIQYPNCKEVLEARVALEQFLMEK